MYAWSRQMVQRSQRRLRNRRQPIALVLMYHRVADLATDPQLLAVSPKHFEEQLQVLCTLAHPLRLSELCQALQMGTLPDRSVVITFDDGYADNLYCARPLLARYDVPATIFVTAGYVGNNREFWWDELERLLLQPGTLPEHLHLHLDGSTYQRQAGEAAVYTETEHQRHRDWHIERVDDPTPRHRLYRDLYHRLHLLGASERRRVVHELRVWANIDAAGRPTHRILTHEELIALADDDVIEIGAHTLTHPPLAALSSAEQRQEIAGSKRSLENNLGRVVASFAYPHGSLSAETVAEVRAAGFTCACSSEPNVVWPDADHFQLPRVVARDWDGDTFARWLKGWIGG
ncbi:MAG TPA: polysaccharide deacetylase family protein [Anaerolineae bacterium]